MVHRMYDHSDAVRMERLMGLGPYYQCACHRGEFIRLHFMFFSSIIKIMMLELNLTLRS